MSERPRLVEFDVPTWMIRNQTPHVVMLFSGLIVLRAEHLLAYDVIRYTAIAPMLGDHPEGDAPHRMDVEQQCYRDPDTDETVVASLYLVPARFKPYGPSR